MLPRRIGEIDEDDLNALVTNQVIESKTIEYKESLPGNSLGEKKEFLADVCSFANTAGGDLILGLTEDRDSGILKSVNGVDIPNVDREKSRLSSLIRDGIEPRIWRVDIHPVRLSNSKTALVIRIPNSWNSPHRVSLRGSNKFYARHASGKYEMDVGELRIAFTLSEAVTENIRRFREDRVSKVISGETPVPLLGSARIVLHLMSMGAFDPGRNYDIQTKPPLPQEMNPINLSTQYERYNFDGLLHASSTAERGIYGYVQLFRNGMVEAVDGSLIEPNGKVLIIPGLAFERQLINSTREYLHVLEGLNIEPPILLFLTLIGVKGYSIAFVAPDRIGVPVSGIIDTIERDLLLIPEIVIESYDVTVPEAMKPCFDSVSNASGLSRSLSYNDKGKWSPQ